MADNYIVTITYQLEGQNVVSESSSLGKQAGDAFASAFKPKIDLSKAIDAGDIGKNLTSELNKALRSGPLSQSIAETFGGAMGTAAGRLAPPSRPARIDAGLEELSKGIESFTASTEAFTALMKGAPLMAAAQILGRGFSGFGGRVVDPERVYFPGGRAGETSAMALARRLGGGAAAEESAGVGGLAETLQMGGAAGLASRLGTKAILPVAAIGGAVAGLTELNKVVGESGIRGAITAERWDDMAKTMGASTRQFIDMRSQWARANINVDDFSNALTRLSINATRHMPAIEREVRESSDSMEESNIKVRDSERAVEEARLSRADATDKSIKTEGELVKVQTIGVEQREEQRRGAELGVSGADLRVRAAAAQADVAPERQAIADVKGPLTVRGATLGIKGAELSQQEAMANFQRVVSGERNPELERYLAIQRAQLALDTTQHNVRQAKAQKREAELDEQQRIEMPQLEERAQQAKAEAELGADRARTARTGLQINQNYNTQQMDLGAAERDVRRAQLDEGAKTDAITRAQAAERRTVEDKRISDMRQVPVIQEAIRGRAPAGFDIREALGAPEQVMKAIFMEGGGRGAGIVEAARKFVTSPAMMGIPEEEGRRAAQQGALRDVFSGVRGVDTQGLLNTMLLPPQQLSKQQERDNQHLADMIDHAIATGETHKVTSEAGTSAEENRRRDLQTGLENMSQAPKAIQIDEQLNQLGNAALGAGGKLGTFGDKLDSAANTAVQALRQFMGLSTSGGGGGEHGATEAVERSGGGPGLVHGQGTSTSDEVPIMVSPDEYVVKAERVREVGVPFMDAFNAGHVGMAEGGDIADAIRRAHVDPVRADPVRVTPVRVDPVRVDPVRADPVRVDPVRVDPVRADPVRVDPVRVDPVRVGFAEGGDAYAWQSAMRAIGLDPTSARDIESFKTYTSQTRNAARARGAAPSSGASAAATASATSSRPFKFSDVVASKSSEDIASREKTTTTGAVPRKTSERVQTSPASSTTPGTSGAGVHYAGDAASSRLGFHRINEMLDTGRGFSLNKFFKGPEVAPRSPSEESESGPPRTQDVTFGAGEIPLPRDRPSEPSTLQKISSFGESLITPGSSGYTPMTSALRDMFLGSSDTTKKPEDQDQDQGYARGGLVGMARRFSEGGLAGGSAFMASAMASSNGSFRASGGSVEQRGGGMDAIGFHQLDLRTNAGTFSAGVSSDTMEGIRRSSLSVKLTETGARPTWYS
jgi:hypothetical protein